MPGADNKRTKYAKPGAMDLIQWWSGGVNLAAGKVAPFGVAIHADNASGRFHHVSFDHTIGLGVDGDVKELKR